MEEKRIGLDFTKENSVDVHGKYQCFAFCKPKFLELPSRSILYLEALWGEMQEKGKRENFLSFSPNVFPESLSISAPFRHHP